MRPPSTPPQSDGTAPADPSALIDPDELAELGYRLARLLLSAYRAARAEPDEQQAAMAA
jgi:hypothetical protein